MDSVQKTCRTSIERFGKQLSGKFCDVNKGGIAHCITRRKDPQFLFLALGSFLDSVVGLSDWR